MKVVIIILATLLFTPITHAQVTITGEVQDANGKAPVLAHTSLSEYSLIERPSAVITPVTDGRFSITVSAKGLYQLSISAVDHEEVSIPIVVEPNVNSHIIVSVRLKPVLLQRQPASLYLDANWNTFDQATPIAMPLHHHADKTPYYSCTLLAQQDTLRYQLGGITSMFHTVNGQQADYYTYDGEGDYYSVIHTKKGDSITITYDPAASAYHSDPSLPTVRIEDRLTADLYTFKTMAEALEERSARLEASAQAETTIKKAREHEFDTLMQLINAAQANGNHYLEEFIAANISAFLDPRLDNVEPLLSAALAHLPANSIMWTINPAMLVRNISFIKDTSIRSYWYESLMSNPSLSVQASVLGKAVREAKQHKDTATWYSLYARFKKAYGHLEISKMVLIDCNPDRALTIGKSVPAFSLRLLDSAATISNSSLLGRYYLIDFWATWCSPCVAEIPGITLAYNRFKGKKGFEIVSISLDAAESQIAPFRKKQWKMPWLHAYAPGAFESEVAKHFEVTGIPRPVLVGPDGKIIATDAALRGDNLEKTLSKYLDSN